jgi:hypothetical protein
MLTRILNVAVPLAVLAAFFWLLAADAPALFSDLSIPMSEYRQAHEGLNQLRP